MRIRRKGYMVLLPAAAAALILFVARRDDDVPAVREFRAEIRRLGLTVAERGYLTSARSVPVAVQATGEILELVRNGAYVKRGELVVRTDITDLDERIEERELSIHGINTEKEVSEAEYQFEQIKATNDLAVLKARLEFARLRYSTARAGLTDEDRRLLEIDEKIALLDLEDAEDELARQERLFKKKFISRSALEPFERRVESGKERMKELRTRSILKAKGVPEEELLELKREAERLEALLKRNTAARARRLEQVSARTAVSEARMAKEAHELTGMRRERSLSETTAPTNGVVSLRLMRDWGSGGRWTEYKPGIRVYRSDLVADIINPGAMTVQVMIHESDIDRARPGMACSVHLPAFPDRDFAGRISEIGGLGRDRYDVAPRGFDDAHTGVTVFNASVTIDAGHGLELRPGMSAVVKIEADPPRDRLVVPRPAVNRENNDFFVVLKDRFGRKKRAVKGRVYNEHYFEVEDGLEPGDTVLVPSGQGGT